MFLGFTEKIYHLDLYSETAQKLEKFGFHCVWVCHCLAAVHTYAAGPPRYNWMVTHGHGCRKLTIPSDSLRITKRSSFLPVSCTCGAQNSSLDVGEISQGVEFESRSDCLLDLFPAILDVKFLFLFKYKVIMKFFRLPWVQNFAASKACVSWENVID